jgi:hypothetical protein
MGTSLTFRYRGILNWKKIYKGTFQFFRDKEADVEDIQYKDKTNEFEGQIAAARIKDGYTKFEWKIAYKAFDMVPTSQEGVFNGKLTLTIEADTKDNYSMRSIAGEKNIFNKDSKFDSWLKNVYDKITLRDREEDNEGEALDLAQQYIEWLKTECNADMKNG